MFPLLPLPLSCHAMCVAADDLVCSGRLPASWCCIPAQQPPARSMYSLATVLGATLCWSLVDFWNPLWVPRSFASPGWSGILCFEGLSNTRCGKRCAAGCARCSRVVVEPRASLFARWHFPAGLLRWRPLCLLVSGKGADEDPHPEFSS